MSLSTYCHIIESKWCATEHATQKWSKLLLLTVFFSLCCSVLGLWVSRFWHVLALHSLEKLKFHVATIYGCGSQSSFVHDTKSKIEFVLLHKQHLSLPAPHLNCQISRDYDVMPYNLRGNYRRFVRTHCCNVLLNITLNIERLCFAETS
jgi:hypothetical protein